MQSYANPTPTLALPVSWHYSFIANHDSITPEILSPQERTLYLTKTSSRQVDFLRGRAAAKRAVAYYLKQSYNVTVLPYECEILADPWGALSVTITNTDLQNITPPHVSISHTSDRGASAGVADPRVHSQIGVDMEEIRMFKPETVREFLNEHELKFLTQQPCSQENFWCTLFWTLKEGVLKAEGCGLRKHPRSVNVLPYITRRDRPHKNMTGHWTVVHDDIILSIILKTLS